MPHVTVTFTMTDGRKLTCDYDSWVIRGCCSGPPENWEPDHHEKSEPEFHLDGRWISEDNLPRGMEAIIEKMYGENSAQDDRFSYVERPFEPEPCDY